MTAVDWIYLTGIVLISAMVGLVCFRLGMAHERRGRVAERDALRAERDQLDAEVRRLWAARRPRAQGEPDMTAADALEAATKDPQWPGDYLTTRWLADRAATLRPGGAAS